MTQTFSNKLVGFIQDGLQQVIEVADYKLNINNLKFDFSIFAIEETERIDKPFNYYLNSRVNIPNFL